MLVLKPEKLLIVNMTVSCPLVLIIARFAVLNHGKARRAFYLNDGYEENWRVNKGIASFMVWSLSPRLMDNRTKANIESAKARNKYRRQLTIRFRSPYAKNIQNQRPQDYKSAATYRHQFS